MQSVDVYLIVGEGDGNKLSVATTLDTVPDVVEATREFVDGPLRSIYPALYSFTEFGLQAIESFTIAITGIERYTARIGVADLSKVPLFDRELAAQLAANFVTGLRIARGNYEEAALQLIATEHGENWENASFTVEPGQWLVRHLLGDGPRYVTPIRA